MSDLECASPVTTRGARARLRLEAAGARVRYAWNASATYAAESGGRNLPRGRQSWPQPLGRLQMASPPIRATPASFGSIVSLPAPLIRGERGWARPSSDSGTRQFDETTGEHETWTSVRC